MPGTFDLTASLADVDPKAWSEAISNLSGAATVLLTVIIVLGFVLLLWRGSEYLKIPGAGVEIRKAREEAAKDRADELAERKKEREAFEGHFRSASESDKRLRRDFRVTIAWIAMRLGGEAPELDPIEDSDPSIVPPPNTQPARTRVSSQPDVEAMPVPVSRRGQRQSMPSRS